MKIVDIKARNEKELKKIQNKVDKFVKSVTCNKGEIRWSNTGAMQHVEVENDGRIGDDIADIVRKSDFGVLQDVREYKGSYDWSSDTYIRPCSVVSFTF